jgi:predicted dehydrogenase
MISNPIRCAVAGIGGFGGSHHSSLHILEQEGLFKVIATCDPRAATLEAEKERNRFSQRGVKVYEAFDAMLADHAASVDLVTLATPIQLHAPMHKACVERGIACYLEKPPTLDPVELEGMIAVDAAATHATQVGFNYIYQPFRHALKARIAGGEFGKLLRVSFHGMWPRMQSYYTRNGWAGRLLIGDQILLDSCCGNAMAHHLHNILFFAGIEDPVAWGTPASVDAELYRANPIEGTDTVFTRGVLTNGVEFRIATSHACGAEHTGREILTCEKAEIEIDPTAKTLTIRHCDGRVEKTSVDPATLYDNFVLYAQYMRGEVPRPATLLADTRGFVALNGLLYLAAGGITTVEAPHAAIHPSSDGTSTIHQIAGIEAIAKRMIETGEFPSEQSLPWAKPGGSATADQLGDLLPRLREMAWK